MGMPSQQFIPKILNFRFKAAVILPIIKKCPTLFLSISIGCYYDTYFSVIRNENPKCLRQYLIA